MISRLGFLKTMMAGGLAMPFGNAVGEGFVNPVRPTPWTPIPLAAGFSAEPGFTPQYRRNGGNLELAGQLTSTLNTSANVFAQFSLQLPGGYYNPTIEKFALAIMLDINGAPNTTACVIGMLIGAGLTGVLSFAFPTGNTSPNPIVIVLDGCIIPITSH